VGPQQKQQHDVILLIKLAQNTMMAITVLKQFFLTAQQAAIYLYILQLMVSTPS
jgi:hypothetical protein